MIALLWEEQKKKKDHSGFSSPSESTSNDNRMAHEAFNSCLIIIPRWRHTPRPSLMIGSVQLLERSRPNIRRGITRLDVEIRDWFLWSKSQHCKKIKNKKNTVSCQARCRQRCWESAEPRPPTPQGAYRQCATNKPLIDSLAFFHPPGSKRRGPVGTSLGSWWQHCQSAWVTHQITPASVIVTRIWLRDQVFQLRVYYQALLSAVFTIQEGPGLKSVTKNITL